MEVQHCTAETVSSLAFIQSSMTAPSLAIFISAASGVSPMGMYFLMAASLACAASSLSFMRVDAAHDLGEVERFDGDAGALQQLFGVADGVEGRGARADGAEADVLEAAHDAADGGEPGEVGLELGRVRRFGVQRGERVGDAVLLEVVADRHLAAEAVAAEGDGHLAGVVGRGLDEDGHAAGWRGGGRRRGRALRRSWAG